VSQLHGIPKRDSPGRGRPSQGAQRKSQINFQTSGYSTIELTLTPQRKKGVPEAANGEDAWIGLLA